MLMEKTAVGRLVEVVRKKCDAKRDGQISAQQFYKGTRRLSRAVRKQQEEQDQFLGKESPDECTLKTGR